MTLKTRIYKSSCNFHFKKKIPPYEYPKLFMNGLESDNLARMLEVFNRFFKRSVKNFPYY